MTINFNAHPKEGELSFRVDRGDDPGNSWVWLYASEEDYAARNNFGCIHLCSENPRSVLDRLRSAVEEYEALNLSSGLAEAIEDELEERGEPPE